MDFIDLRNAVRDNIGELVEDFWKETDLKRYLNEALYRFSQEERWPWLVSEGSGTLTGGSPDLDLEVGIAATRHINIMLTLDGGRPWVPKRVDNSKGFELRTMYTQETTYPAWYYVTSVVSDTGVQQATVKFVPTPVSDLDVEYQYFRVPSSMVNDTDVPDLPVEYHQALVHYAAGTAWLKELNGAAKASEQFQQYGGIVEQARGEWLTEPDDTPLVMGQDEPQYDRGVWATADPMYLRMPSTLGP
jgi:hypothetical protein